MARRGQTLVETALVIPAVMVVLLLLLQLLLVAGIKIRLLAAASRVTQASAIDLHDRSAVLAEAAPFFSIGRMSGVLDPAPTLQRVTIPWRSYSGFSTLNGPGFLVRRTFRYRLQRRRFLHWTMSARFLHADAALPEEPRIPGER